MQGWYFVLALWLLGEAPADPPCPTIQEETGVLDGLIGGWMNGWLTVALFTAYLPFCHTARQSNTANASDLSLVQCKTQYINLSLSPLLSPGFDNNVFQVWSCYIGTNVCLHMFYRLMLQLLLEDTISHWNKQLLHLIYWCSTAWRHIVWFANAAWITAQSQICLRIQVKLLTAATDFLLFPPVSQQ